MFFPTRCFVRSRLSTPTRVPASAVRERMLWIAASYERAAPRADSPPPTAFDSVADACSTLVDAIAQGDLDRVDAAASWVVDVARFDQLMALGAPTLDMLGAAGHAAIAFFLTSRVATTSRSAVTLLRPMLRELARAPQLRLQWAHHAAAPAGQERQLAAALAATPRLGLPGSDFIYPLVHQVDDTGVARDVIESAIPADVDRAATAILRVAARSMLQDDAAFAPYGWTHCLTLPQGVLEIIPWLPDPHLAAAVAATYVVGFRAAEGRDVIDLEWEPEPTSVDLLPSLEQGPEIAGRAWYHASADATAQALPDLVGRAAVHEDAHLAKYTFACLGAAERDPLQRHLYLAAAASLAAWWAARP